MTMASKRPSYVSIRARQRNIIEGLGTRDLTYGQAAKEFGVTRQQFKKFVESKPKNLRSSYNRSPAYQKLYREGERKETRRVLGARKGIKHYKKFADIPQRGVTYTPQQANEQQINKMLQNLYVTNHAGGATWANYAREHRIPSSLDAIILMHNNGKIDDHEFVSVVRAWQGIYGVSEARVMQILDDLYDNEEAA